MGLIESTRKGVSNNKAVIFACLLNAKESAQILALGANFLLRKPLSEEGVAMHITISKELLLRERRRYFRHAVNLPVTLKEGPAEQQARITNLSGSGMAVRTVKPLKQGAEKEVSYWTPGLRPGSNSARREKRRKGERLFASESLARKSTERQRNVLTSATGER